MRENPATGFRELQPVGRLERIDAPLPLFDNSAGILEGHSGHCQMPE
jgi:hypothetical protein